MHLILPVSGLAQDLFHRTKFFTEPYGISPLSFEGAVDVCQSIVEEAVFNRLHWTDNLNLTDTALHRYLDWWVSGRLFSGNEEISVCCQKYYCDIIDITFCQVSSMVDQHIGSENSDAMWLIWYTKRLGHDIVLERGPDYRVVEFERSVLAGNIKVSAKARDDVHRRHLMGGGL